MNIARRTAIRKALNGEVYEVRFNKDINPINIEGLMFGHSVIRTIVELIKDKVITEVKVRTRFNVMWFKIAEENGDE